MKEPRISEKVLKAAYIRKSWETVGHCKVPCVLAYTAPPVCHCAFRGGRNKQTALFAPGLSGAEDTGGAGEGRSRCVLELRQPGPGGRCGPSLKAAQGSYPAAGLLVKPVCAPSISAPKTCI